MRPLTVPQQATAIRPTWSELPADARVPIERYAEAASDWLAKRRSWR
jgi:hypothetical protein